MRKDDKLGFIKGTVDAALQSMQGIGGGFVQQEAKQFFQEADKVILLTWRYILKHRNYNETISFLRTQLFDTAEIRFFAVRSPRFWVSGYCTKWRIQGQFW